jgi:hypothetical protein
MINPIFSVIATAIRPENYKQCYDSLWQNSKVPFEMIFVGDRPPTGFVGENFRYIYATVKPSQCVEIASREAQGQYLIPISDDCIFSEHILDLLYDEISSTDTSQYLVSFVLMPCYKEIKVIKTSNYYGVELGDGVCYPTDLWKRIGGIDKKFIYAFFDWDLQLRLYEYGLKPKIIKHIYMKETYPKLSNEEADLHKKNSVFSRYINYHSSLLDFLWLREGFRVSEKRLSPEIGRASCRERV